jgi:hypothetical protein
MGKKLSSWEKAARERQREREAAERRAKTAARKDREKAVKEREKELYAKLGSTYAKLFDELYDRLTNLTSTDRAKEINAQQAIQIPPKLKELKSLVNLSYQSVSSEYTQNDFKESELLRDAESDKNMDFATYKNKYGSFFSNLFGSTTKKYQEFIIEATRKAQDALAKDEERKKKFHEALLEYEEAIKNHNKTAETKLSLANNKRNEIFVQLNNDIKSLNKEIESISQHIELAFKNYIHSDFVDLIGLNLPLQFPDLDEVANNLISDISEIDKTFYDSPSNGFEYGLKINESNIILYVKYSKDYFPFPSRLQINETAQSFSVTSLTKNRIKQIDDNLVAGIVLCYIAYIFNSVPEVNELTIYTVKDDIDDATGKPVLNPEQGLKVTRSHFFDLQFDRLVPFQTNKSFSFKVDKDIELENIHWFKINKSKNRFLNKIQMVNNTINNIKKSIALLDSEDFNHPLDKNFIKTTENLEKYVIIKGAKTKQTQTRKKQTNKKQAISKKSSNIIDNKPKEIGNYIWDYKNLDVDTFRNGEAIPHAKTDRQWAEAGEKGLPAWCWSTDDPEKRLVYGKLYNHYAVTDPRGLAPEGWRIPNDNELKDLLIEGKYGYLPSPEINLPLAGARIRSSGSLSNVGSYGYYWSGSVSGTDARALTFLSSAADMVSDMDSFHRATGGSVRCLRD